jgi:hypothetical protein
VRSVRDRVRHRFAVACCELDDAPHPTRQVMVMTTSGNNPGKIRAILEQVLSLIRSNARCWPIEVDVDVFRWHPQGRIDGSFPN